MAVWEFWRAAAWRAFHWAKHLGHETHVFLVLLSGVLVWFSVHLEHYAMAVALPLVVFLAVFVIGLFREAFVLYGEEHGRRQEAEAQRQKDIDLLEQKHREELDALRREIEALKKDDLGDARMQKTRSLLVALSDTERDFLRELLLAERMRDFQVRTYLRSRDARLSDPNDSAAFTSTVFGKTPFLEYERGEWRIRPEFQPALKTLLIDEQPAN